VVVVVGVGDRRVLEASGREMLDVLMSLLCKKYKKITDPSNAMNGEVMCALGLETNTKSAITMIFGFEIFCKIN
jgi:hypothetical protein